MPVVTAAPQLPPPALAARPRKVPAWRRSRVTPVFGGVPGAPPAGLEPSLRRAVPPRRRRTIEPVWPQQVVQAPGFVAATLDPARRPTAPRRRRGAVYGPPWPQQTTATPSFVPDPVRRRVSRPPLPRRGEFLAVPVTSDVPRNLSRAPRRLVVPRRGRLWLAPVPAAQLPASPAWVPGTPRPRVRVVPRKRAAVFRSVPLGSTAPVVHWRAAAVPQVTIRPNLATLTAAANRATASAAPNRAQLTITEEA